MESLCRHGEAIIAGMGRRGGTDTGAWKFMKDTYSVNLEQIASPNYTRNAQTQTQTHVAWDSWSGIDVSFTVAYYPQNDQVPALSDVVVIYHWTGIRDNYRTTRYYSNGGCHGVFCHMSLDTWARASGYAPRKYRPDVSALRGFS